MLIEITKAQAENMCDFLGAEFIERIYKDTRYRNEYISNIYEVYKKFQEVAE